MVVVEAGILCWLVCYVRGGDQHFWGTEYACDGCMRPEITGLYANPKVVFDGLRGYISQK